MHAPSLSPGGAAACSLGRQPQDHEQHDPESPGGATRPLHDRTTTKKCTDVKMRLRHTCCRPFGTWELWNGLFLGLSPQATCDRPSGTANRANRKHSKIREVVIYSILPLVLTSLLGCTSLPSKTSILPAARNGEDEKIRKAALQDDFPPAGLVGAQASAR